MCCSSRWRRRLIDKQILDEGLRDGLACNERLELIGVMLYLEERHSRPAS